jgi:hypothetical protein
MFHQVSSPFHLSYQTSEKGNILFSEGGTDEGGGDAVVSERRSGELGDDIIIIIVKREIRGKSCLRKCITSTTLTLVTSTTGRVTR